MTEGRFPDREPPLGVFVPCELPRTALTSGNTDRVAARRVAEDTRFELVRGCPQHAFQDRDSLFWDDRESRYTPCLQGIRTLMNGGEPSRLRPTLRPSPRPPRTVC
jgi:hypothetical protein